MTGENGLAQTIIFFSNVLEAWNSKLNTFAYNGAKLNDSDWQAFYSQMDEWLETINKTLTYVGKSVKDNDNLEEGKPKKETKPV
jgi:hypothetical protein